MTRDAVTPVAVTLDRSTGTPLAVQLAGQVRALIQTGVLISGSRLPSTRALAADLAVARGVVEQGVDQLAAEGWVVSRPGSGTFVAEGVGAGRRPAPSARSAGEMRPSPRGRRPRIELGTGTPWVDTRHRDGWRRAWRTVSASRIPRGYPDPAGLPALREAVADYVGRHRGFVCSPGQVLITSGTAHALSLLLDAMRRGAIAIEDPGYRAAVAVARDAGWRVVDVPVDEEGIDVGALCAHEARDLRAVYVTPAHQHPLGVTMSAARRVALIEEARRRDALIVEDDYDSEFRYDVAPLPALAQLGLEQVAYVGTASKTVGPGLRLGWIVAHEARVAEIAARRERRHDHPNWPVQQAMLTMFAEGHVDRVVRAARRVYAERSLAVAAAVGPYGIVAGAEAGMYLTLHLPAAFAARVCGEAARHAVDVPLLVDYCRSASRGGVVIGFGGLTDLEFERALDVLSTALRHGR